jgi:hypothetical protein
MEVGRDRLPGETPIVMVHLNFLVDSSYVNSALPFALLSVGGTSKEPLRSAVNAVVSASANEVNPKKIIVITDPLSLFIEKPSSFITRSSFGEAFALQTRSVALTLDPPLSAPRLTPRAMIGTTQQFHPIDKKSPQRAAVLTSAKGKPRAELDGARLCRV